MNFGQGVKHGMQPLGVTWQVQLKQEEAEEASAIQDLRSSGSRALKSIKGMRCSGSIKTI